MDFDGFIMKILIVLMLVSLIVLLSLPLFVIYDMITWTSCKHKDPVSLYEKAFEQNFNINKIR